MCSNFRSPKVQYKERWAVDVFRNWQASHKKNIISFTQAGECDQIVQSLEERLIGTRLQAGNLAPFSQPDGYKFNNCAPVFIYWIHMLYLNKHTYPLSSVVHIVNIETLPKENY